MTKLIQFPQATDTERIADLQADVKRVYNVGPNALADLAEKYNVSTRSLDYARQHRDEFWPTIGAQAFKSKSDIAEIQRKLYATIKRQLRELGA